MKQRICLNIIVKNETPVIRRCLDSVRPYVDYWVIVDTGSTDGTQELIRAHLTGLPGELYERPWRNFGHNRTEALELARGKGDYVLIMDADNIFHAPPGWRFPALDADGYAVLHRDGDTVYEVCTLITDRRPWRYVGVLHEYLTTEEPHRIVPLPGAWIERRHQGARSRDPETFRRDAAILEQGLADEPGNTRYAFYLAQSLRDAGELQRSREAYLRRAAMGGWDEEIWRSLFEAAVLGERLDLPPAEVQYGYLAAHQFRPRRAEALAALARWHRQRQEWHLAALFAEAASAIPKPDDRLFLDESVYAWRIDDERAIAAFYTGRPLTSFAIASDLLEHDRLPNSERPRVEANRDFCADARAEETARYPEAIVSRVLSRERRPQSADEVTLTITSCKRMQLFERTVNSFLNCCADLHRIGRYVCIDDNSSDADRARMRELYPFFDFILKDPDEKGHARSMNRLRETVRTPYWLHLEDDWHFIVGCDYVGRARAVLDVEPRVGQVCFNRNYAETLADRALVGGMARKTSHPPLRYILHEYLAEGSAFEAYRSRLPAGVSTNAWWPHFSLRPGLARTGALHALGPFSESTPAFEREYALRYIAGGWRTAFFDGVYATHTGRLTTERGSGKPNAYELNGVRQF